MFDNESNFMSNQSLRRDEAAAFFARFSRDVLWNTPDTNKTECNNFTDLSLGHNNLRWEMIAACQLGLMRWHNNRFMPTDTFSNAHALTVMIRLLIGEQPESWSHWAENYRMKASNIWLNHWLIARQKVALDFTITRWEVARLIEAWSAYQNPNNHINISKIPRDIQMPYHCDRTGTGWPNNNYFAAVKIVNAKLQQARDSNQTMTDQLIADAYNILSKDNISLQERCTNSRVIHALENQPWFIENYEIDNDWNLILSVDFLSFSDTEGGDRKWQYFRYQNQSNKTREYKTHSDVKLPVLHTDDSWHVLSIMWSRPKQDYINDVDLRLNTFCNREPIYTTESYFYLEEWGDVINWNENWRNCIKDNLVHTDYFKITNFKFKNGKIIMINLSRDISAAG